MKRLCLSLFAVLILTTITINTYASFITVRGDVSGQWSADTVLVDGNLNLPAGDNLIIDPGTVIIFRGHYRFTVFGSLKAMGSINDTILFTVPDTTGFHIMDEGKGGWAGIRFITPDGENPGNRPTTEESSLAFCRFEYGKATTDPLNYHGGAIASYYYNNLNISKCYFYNNYSFYSGGSIFLNYSDAIIEDCVFKNNYSGNTTEVYGYGGGVCALNSSPVLRKNVFLNNISTGVGGAASFDNSDPIFEFNILKGNKSGLGGGLGMLRSSPTSTINNNLIINNIAVFFGGGVCCIRSNPVISNLTIANNISMYGGGLYCNDSAVPVIYNTIIWGNTALGYSVTVFDIYSAPDFYYCNIEGDTSDFSGSGALEGYHGRYENNININPNFATESAFPFSLSPGSPCINSGTPDASSLALPDYDLSGNDRINNNRIDMGAYEYQSAVIIPEGEVEDRILAYPNPFTSEIRICVSTPGQVIITGINGSIIRVLEATINKKADCYEVIWNGCNLKGQPVPGGVYLITNQNKETGRIVKL